MRLTDEDFIDRILRKTALLEDDECGQPLTAEDEKYRRKTDAELRRALRSLSQDALFRLYNAFTVSYSSQCSCGRIHKVDGLTGEMTDLDATGHPDAK